MQGKYFFTISPTDVNWSRINSWDTRYTLHNKNCFSIYSASHRSLYLPDDASIVRNVCLCRKKSLYTMFLLSPSSTSINYMKSDSSESCRFKVIKNTKDYYIFFCTKIDKILDYSNSFVGYTLRAVCMRIFKSPALLEVP